MSGCHVNLQNYCKLFGHTLPLEERTRYFVKQYFIVNCIIRLSSITDHGLKAIRFKGDKASRIYETQNHQHLPYRVHKTPHLHRLRECNGVLLPQPVPGTSKLLAIAGNRVVKIDKPLIQSSDPLSC